MPKNYYLILGIADNASREDIKTAFRRRALELHPDRSGLESGPFREVQEAYSVLGNPERRRRYDRNYSPPTSRRHRPGSAPEPLVRERPQAEPFSPVERVGGFREVSLAESYEVYRPSFDELFNRFWSNFEPLPRSKSEQLESLTVEVVVGLEEARSGGRVRVWIPARVACSACGGHGTVGAYECWQCEGHGSLSTEHPVEVEYPPGIPDGHAIRIPLTHFGIENFYLTVLLRVSGVGD